MNSSRNVSFGGDGGGTAIAAIAGGATAALPQALSGEPNEEAPVVSGATASPAPAPEPAPWPDLPSAAVPSRETSIALLAVPLPSQRRPLSSWAIGTAEGGEPSPFLSLLSPDAAELLEELELIVSNTTTVENEEREQLQGSIYPKARSLFDT